MSNYVKTVLISISFLLLRCVSDTQTERERERVVGGGEVFLKFESSVGLSILLFCFTTTHAKREKNEYDWSECYVYLLADCFLFFF